MSATQKGTFILDRPPTPNANEMARKALPETVRKFLVMSGKGGVGKTSTAVNIAMALSSKGVRVGILDADIHGPDIPGMLGLKGMLSANDDKKIVPMKYSDHLVVVSMESLISDTDDAIIWRGPMKHAVIRQFIGEVSWGDIDFLVIDSPPGTGDEPLAVAQILKDARAVIVTTPQEVALSDVRKSISFCKTVKMEIFGIVENMSGYVCPHCRKAIDIFGSGGGEKMAERYGLPFLGKIPIDPDMVKCGDSGISYQESHPDSDVTRVFSQIAGRMMSSVT